MDKFQQKIYKMLNILEKIEKQTDKNLIQTQELHKHLKNYFQICNALYDDTCGYWILK